MNHIRYCKNKTKQERLLKRALNNMNWHVVPEYRIDDYILFLNKIKEVRNENIEIVSSPRRNFSETLKNYPKLEYSDSEYLSTSSESNPETNIALSDPTDEPNTSRNIPRSKKYRYRGQTQEALKRKKRQRRMIPVKELMEKIRKATPENPVTRRHGWTASEEEAYYKTTTDSDSEYEAMYQAEKLKSPDTSPERRYRERSRTPESPPPRMTNKDMLKWIEMDKQAAQKRTERRKADTNPPKRHQKADTNPQKQHLKADTNPPKQSLKADLSPQKQHPKADTSPRPIMGNSKADTTPPSKKPKQDDS